MTKVLEQMLGSEILPTMGQDRMYATIDTYAVGTTALYSFDPPKPIGTFSNFQLGSPGNIRQDMNVGLQERYDFSGHNGTEPHLNYDLLGAKRDFILEALGNAHYMDLFKK
jgi:hypothetical protein